MTKSDNCGQSPQAASPQSAKKLKTSHGDDNGGTADTAELTGTSSISSHTLKQRDESSAASMNESSEAVAPTAPSYLANTTGLDETSQTLEAKREYNRRNAARARLRNKLQLQELRQKVDELSKTVQSLRNTNASLTDQLKDLMEQNIQLTKRQEQLQITPTPPLPRSQHYPPAQQLQGTGNNHLQGSSLTLPQLLGLLQVQQEGSNMVPQGLQTSLISNPGLTGQVPSSLSSLLQAPDPVQRSSSRVMPSPPETAVGLPTISGSSPGNGVSVPSGSHHQMQQLIAALSNNPATKQPIEIQPNILQQQQQVAQQQQLAQLLLAASSGGAGAGVTPSAPAAVPTVAPAASTNPSSNALEQVATLSKLFSMPDSRNDHLANLLLLAALSSPSSSTAVNNQSGTQNSGQVPTAVAPGPSAPISVHPSKMQVLTGIAQFAAPSVSQTPGASSQVQSQVQAPFPTNQTSLDLQAQLLCLLNMQQQSLPIQSVSNQQGSSNLSSSLRSKVHSTVSHAAATTTTSAPGKSQCEYSPELSANMQQQHPQPPPSPPSNKDPSAYTQPMQPQHSQQQQQQQQQQPNHHIQQSQQQQQQALLQLLFGGGIEGMVGRPTSSIYNNAGSSSSGANNKNDDKTNNNFDWRS